MLIQHQDVMFLPALVDQRHELQSRVSAQLLHQRNILPQLLQTNLFPPERQFLISEHVHDRRSFLPQHTGNHAPILLRKLLPIQILNINLPELIQPLKLRLLRL